jgi:hypothetical protein
MIKALILIAALGSAGVLAGAGVGSSPGASHALPRCKPKQKTHCVKPKPTPVKPRTVTRIVTATASATTIQTVTTTQTVTVTSAAPVAKPAPGTYSGLTQNSSPISFKVPDGSSLQQLTISEVDTDCVYSDSPMEKHHVLNNLTFAGSWPFDIAGNFTATGSFPDEKGDPLTVTVTGTVKPDGTAVGSAAVSGNLPAGGGTFWKCDSRARWTATRQ